MLDRARGDAQRLRETPITGHDEVGVRHARDDELGVCRPDRSMVLFAENSFHGKTKGVLSYTDGPLYQGEFKLLHNGVKVPFGDIDAIEAART